MLDLAEELRRTLRSLATGPASRPEASFSQRAAALDQLEIHVFDRLLYSSEGAPLPGPLLAVEAEAIAARRALQTAIHGLLETLRGQIRTRRLIGEALAGELLSHAGPAAHGGGYDALDLLVSGLMDVGPPAAERVVREPEMVYYQPTPAREMLELTARAVRPGDVFCDLGAGLGRVVIWVALLSRARAIGVEIEPAYVEHAQRCAQSLNVEGVELLRGDAREASLSAANVFFMYTPFRGAILRRVLDRLAIEARSRPITLATFGSCTAQVAQERWLKPPDQALTPTEIAVFRSR